MISVDRRQLSQAIAFAHLAIERRSTVPVLTTARAVANGLLAIEGSDLEMTARAEVPYKGEPTTFLIPEPGKVRSAIGAAGGELVGFTPDGATKLGLACGPLACALSTLPPEDHPGAEPVSEELWGCDVSAGEIAQIARTFPAMSTEETRYYLNGVCIDRIDEASGWLFRFVTTDGHRLMLADVPLPGATGDLPERAIVPRRFMRAVETAFAKTKEPLRFSYGYATRRNADKPDLVERFGGAKFQVSGTVNGARLTLATKLIDGTYPDYTRVVPSEAATPVLIRVQRADLAQAVNAVCAVSSEKTRAVRLTAEKGKLRVALKSPDIGEGSFAIDAEHNAPKGFEIGMNGRYLLDLAASLRGDEIELLCSDGSAPMVVRDPSDTAFCAVQMPMRV